MTEKHDQPTSPSHGPSHHALHYYSELNRVVSVLFVGVLALMTFLLTVGVQRPHNGFKWALYSAIVVLALNLIAYMAGHMFHSELMSKKLADAPEGETEAKAHSTGLKSARRRLKMARMVQQALFIVAVACIVWFAISAAQFFFALPATPAGPMPQ